MTASALAQDLGLDVEEPLTLDDPDAIAWDEEADLVVVGLGGAGISAALEGLERGLSVVAVDRYGGGGSTAANGGVFYAGGGTAIQQAAGEDDDPEEMLKYLRIEAGEVVSVATLRRFVAESPETIDWITAHGGRFDPSVWKEKSSYPPLDRFLYHPDNSLVAGYRARARPAARGHRAFARNGKKAWGLGKGITAPLTASALALGLRFHRFSEARQLIRDGSGRVIGVKILSIPEGSADAARFQRYIARADTLLAMLPPSIPLASLTIALGNRYLRKAMAIEARGRITRMIRARQGVLLSAGGFIMNPRMVAHYAPTYAKGMPNGTLGDQGSGIVLGMSAGGATALMDKISAWRFINPPKAWSDAIVVNRAGERFVDETVYGATLGEHIGDHQGGIAWLIYDKAIRRQAFAQARDPKLVPFQRDVTRINLLFNARKAPTLEALATRIGVDPLGLAATVAAYNAAATGGEPDPFGKEPVDMQPIAEGPFYAMDISIESRFLPLPVITFGGLRVVEETGQVIDTAGAPIDGLYAAGRTAVGIASQTYVSGLSFADCVFSGRRAARHAARANH
jgi:3-oxo-5alpha-steroid 4-dehydrogenase